MSKFTKGKWKYLEALYEVTAYPEDEGTWRKNKFGWPVYTNGGCWQDITGELCGLDEEEKHANGRLIAAAPEMYELLKELVCWKYDSTITVNLAIKAENLLASVDGKETEHE